MQLGNLMARLEDEGQADSALQALGDLGLLARIEAMGAKHDETPGEYVANASRRFAALASGEDWLDIMGAVERASDPGRAVLHKMLDWALDADREAATGDGGCRKGACTCGGGGGGHHVRS